MVNTMHTAWVAPGEGLTVNEFLQLHVSSTASRAIRHLEILGLKKGWDYKTNLVMVCSCPLCCVMPDSYDEKRVLECN